jgi:hypothetical protein
MRDFHCATDITKYERLSPRSMRDCRHEVIEIPISKNDKFPYFVWEICHHEVWEIFVTQYERLSSWSRRDCCQQSKRDWHYDVCDCLHKVLEIVATKYERKPSRSIRDCRQKVGEIVANKCTQEWKFTFIPTPYETAINSKYRKFKKQNVFLFGCERAKSSVLVESC